MNIAKIKDIVNNSKVLKWIVSKAKLEVSNNGVNLYRFKAKIPNQMWWNFGRETKNVKWDDKRHWQDGMYYKFSYSLVKDDQIIMKLLFDEATKEIDLQIKVYQKYNDYLLSDQVNNLMVVRNEWR